MHYTCAIQKPFATRCQILTFATLAAALLFEMRGLVNDLSLVRSWTRGEVQTSGITLDGGILAGLPDAWPTDQCAQPTAKEAEPDLVLQTDRGSDLTTQIQARHPHLRRRRVDPKSGGIVPSPRWYARNRWLSRVPSASESALASNKTP